MSEPSATRQAIETRNANVRAKAYIGRGSRLVLMSRAIVGALILAVGILLWIARVATGC